MPRTIVLPKAARCLQGNPRMSDSAEARKTRLTTRLETMYANLLEAIATLSDAETMMPVWLDGGHWTAHDLIGHLIATEITMQTVFNAAIAGQSLGADPAFDMNRFNEAGVRRTAQATLPELLIRLKQTHQSTLAQLAAIPATQLDTVVSHMVLGETTVEGIFKRISFHTHLHTHDLRAMHARNIQATL